MATTKTKKKTSGAASARAKPKSAKGQKRPAMGRNAFWRFSLAAYGRTGTAPACLALQDLKGLDVNLLLFCCWAGTKGYALETAELERLIETVEPWRKEVIEPLRAVRRQLKNAELPAGAGSRLLEQVKSAELDAEAIQQKQLFESLTLEPAEASEKIAAENLKTYARLQGVTCDSAVTADLAAVLRGAFPNLAPLEAVWTLI